MCTIDIPPVDTARRSFAMRQIVLCSSARWASLDVGTISDQPP